MNYKKLTYEDQLQRERIYKLKLSCGCMTIVAVVVLLIILWIDPIKPWLDNPKTKYGEAVNLCNGIESGSLDLPMSSNLSVESPPRIAAVVWSPYEKLRYVHDWQKELPKEFRTRNFSSPDVIVCMDRLEKEQGSICKYGIVGSPASGHRFSKRRFVTVYRAFIIDANEGTLIAQDEIEGGQPPRVCPNDPADLGGSEPSFGKFYEMLTRHLPLPPWVVS